ncbi:mitochondrial fission regulator 1 isoform X2 [Kryptolebias marmoratus]|uniref:mitochondrial fission regulator 1 isoform X2 n=1 Tax=Kryptolebias marmoratus TaxID=37003 RepID=UPI0007F8DFFB|nr:mitochondrial fission regulator 1 isoform X2 [Kryptolebias marmoratus]XP_037829252.1 mitochondrial fission regulator 1 isoform X2 [Kryptolebias marmoratus]XP_037829253.1 mitochondrial fission regulator 1 isoform X2 [Kryptolebias marmoratus]
MSKAHVPIQMDLLFPYNEDAGVLIGTRKKTSLVASLADIAWIDRDEEDDDDYLGRPQSGIPPGFVFRAQRPHPRRKPLTRQRSLPSLHQGASDPQGASATNDEAIQKISALETELAKLRAQIAQIVLAQEKTAQSAATTGAPPPPPSGTLPPCPPPPPPPPLPPPGLQRTFSAIDLIKERRGRKTNGPIALDSKATEIPSMLEILKDINKVKLRSVKSRSVEDEAQAKSQGPADAAALIAEALKRKFAHRYRRGSGQEDKEDFQLPVPEVKPQTEAPLFGQHMLKQTGKRKFL